MKKLLLVLVLALCFCVGCQKTKKEKVNSPNIITSEKNQNVHLDLAENELFMIGENDYDYGYEKLVFFNSSMKVVKYFNDAVLPNNTMGAIDCTNPVVLGQLDEDKRNGSTAIDASQYTYGLYNIDDDTWVIPMEYSNLVQFKNGCYGAYMHDEKLDTTSMKIYDMNGNILNDNVDVTNTYVECLGENLWNISYDGNQPITIYNKKGKEIQSISTSYGMVHGDYFVSPNTENGDVIYNSNGVAAITKETVVKKGKLSDVLNQNFYVINYYDYSNMIEAQIGKYQLILDNKGNILSCINQNVEPDTVVEVQYWVYCVTKNDDKRNDDSNGNDSNQDQTNNSQSEMQHDGETITTGVNMDGEGNSDNPMTTYDPQNVEDKGIVTDKEDPIYDMTKANAHISYYDKDGTHLLTTTGEEFQGHLQPYGDNYIPHDLYYKTDSGFEVYDYEGKETYQFDIGDMGIVELQSPMKNYFLVTNELDDETIISLYYKNTLIGQSDTLLVQVLNDNLILANSSPEYALDEVSMIYNKKGQKIYQSPCYEMVEGIGENYIISQRDGVRTIVDYQGNVVFSFDKKIEVE